MNNNDEAIKTAEQESDDAQELTGWVEIPILRGLFEIEPILAACANLGGYVIGGYARYCCSTNENPVKAGDVDIFPLPKDTIATHEACEAIFTAWKDYLLTEGLTVKHENNVSLTFALPESLERSVWKRCPTIQIIKPITEGAIVTEGTLREVLESFDFSIVRVAILSDRRTALAWASFEPDEKRKRLRLLNIHCPISSLLRCMKYARKGYYMRPIESMKLFRDWEGRSPEYRDRIVELFGTGKMGSLTEKEVDELESLLRVD